MKMKFIVLTFCGLVIEQNLIGQRPKDFTVLPKTKWKVKSGPVFGSPVIDNGIAFYASEDSALHAIDIQRGQERWRFGFYNASRSTPVIDKDNLYVISEDGLLYNVNKNTGKLNWQFVTPQGTLGERKYDRAD